MSQGFYRTHGQERQEPSLLISFPLCTASYSLLGWHVQLCLAHSTECLAQSLLLLTVFRWGLLASRFSSITNFSAFHYFVIYFKHFPAVLYSLSGLLSYIPLQSVNFNRIRGWFFLSFLRWIVQNDINFHILRVLNLHK